MSLSDGDSPEEGDVWFRIATQPSHLVRGRVHHSAFGGNAIAPPRADKNRTWTRELSGRLRSMAGTLDEIKRFAETYCEALTNRGGGKATFTGVMYVRVADAKVNYGSCSTAVYYTPLDEDSAHADFTFTGWIGDGQEEKDRFKLWFTDLLTALHHPGQLQLLPQAEDVPSAQVETPSAQQKVGTNSDGPPSPLDAT